MSTLNTHTRLVANLDTFPVCNELLQVTTSINNQQSTYIPLHSEQSKSILSSNPFYPASFNTTSSPFADMFLVRVFGGKYLRENVDQNPTNKSPLNILCICA